MSWESLRGYAQAAGDLSGIARARLLEVVREATRGEIERVGSSLGLAGSEQVALMKRTIERLERRVAALEAATGTGSASDRPARRPSAARSRGTGPGSTRPAGAAGPARTRAVPPSHGEVPPSPATPPTGTAAPASPAPSPGETAEPATSPTSEPTSGPTGGSRPPGSRPRAVRTPAGTPVRRPRPTGSGPSPADPAAPTTGSTDEAPEGVEGESA